jgi:hypothetical protein
VTQPVTLRIFAVMCHLFANSFQTASVTRSEPAARQERLMKLKANLNLRRGFCQKIYEKDE